MTTMAAMAKPDTSRETMKTKAKTQTTLIQPYATQLDKTFAEEQVQHAARRMQQLLSQKNGKQKRPFFQGDDLK